MGFHVSFRECIDVVVPYSLYNYNVWYLTKNLRRKFVFTWAPVVQRQGESLEPKLLRELQSNLLQTRPKPYHLLKPKGGPMTFGPSFDEGQS